MTFSLQQEIEDRPLPVEGRTVDNHASNRLLGVMLQKHQHSDKHEDNDIVNSKPDCAEDEWC